MVHGVICKLFLSLDLFGIFPDRHAFQVLRSKNITSNGYGFLLLEVRVPADGLSRSSNWCFDYQYLCEDFHRRPTGCGIDFREKSGWGDCRRTYNSDMDIGNTLSCNPAYAIAKLAATAFPTKSHRCNHRIASGFTCVHRKIVLRASQIVVTLFIVYTLLTGMN